MFLFYDAGIPRDVDYNDVLSTLLAIDGVIRVHNLRIWALSLDKTALSAHLAIGIYRYFYRFCEKLWYIIFHLILSLLNNFLFLQFLKFRKFCEKTLSSE